MKKSTKLLMTLLALLIFSIFALTVKASTHEPGSQEDPLVTKSYIDKIILDIKKYVDSKTSGERDLEIVYLKKGQVVIGEQGTELILRSGIATVIDSQKGGLSDVTSGADLTKGENVPQNHLLIVPRSDGRGIKAVNDYVVLLVRGNYTIDR